MGCPEISIYGLLLSHLTGVVLVFTHTTATKLLDIARGSMDFSCEKILVNFLCCWALLECSYSISPSLLILNLGLLKQMAKENTIA